VTGASTTIRVASWNIRAAIGPGEPFPPAWWRHVDRVRLARIGAFIGALDADVVVLQEVAVLNPNGELLDQPVELARMTGMQVLYGAVHAFPLIEPEHGRAIGVATWGNAVLTRSPLENAFAIGLPRGADEDPVEQVGSGLPLAGIAFRDADPGVREPRCVVGGRLAGTARDVSIVTTHLTYAGSGQRRQQAEVVARLADGLATPVVVAGDLNAPIEASELAPLRERFDDAFSALGIRAGDQARASCGPLRIDHLLTRGLRASACAVRRDAADASDHWPVVGTFETGAGAGVG
jgi:endonuclease/exonuclease/phosphatase family metal-dependent hydrolase